MTQVRISEETNDAAIRIAGKVNAALAEQGKDPVSKRAVLDAATNEFFKECAKREGESFDKWIVSMFKGEF